MNLEMIIMTFDKINLGINRGYIEKGIFVEDISKIGKSYILQKKEIPVLNINDLIKTEFGITPPKKQTGNILIIPVEYISSEIYKEWNKELMGKEYIGIATTADIKMIEYPLREITLFKGVLKKFLFDRGIWGMFLLDDKISYYINLEMFIVYNIRKREIV